MVRSGIDSIFDHLIIHPASKRQSKIRFEKIDKKCDQKMPEKSIEYHTLGISKYSVTYTVIAPKFCQAPRLIEM